MDRNTVLFVAGAAIIAAPLLWQNWQEASAAPTPRAAYTDCLQSSFAADGKRDGEAIGHAYRKCAPQVTKYRSYLVKVKAVDSQRTEKASQRIAEVSYARFAGLEPNQVVGCFKKHKKQQSLPIS